MNTNLYDHKFNNIIYSLLINKNTRLIIYKCTPEQINMLKSCISEYAIERFIHNSYILLPSYITLNCQNANNLFFFIYQRYGKDTLIRALLRSKKILMKAGSNKNIGPTNLITKTIKTIMDSIFDKKIDKKNVDFNLIQGALERKKYSLMLYNKLSAKKIKS